MSVLTVETTDFVTASRVAHDGVGDPLTAAIAVLIPALSDAGGMAGTDSAGMHWAASYDRAARRAVSAGQDAANAGFQLAAMFAQSAWNYERADVASSAKVRRALSNLTGTVSPTPDTCSLAMDLPPAAGAAPESVLSFANSTLGPLLAAANVIVPNGHQDRLHAASGAWRQAAFAVATAAECLRMVPPVFAGDELPESGDIRTVCAGLVGSLTDLEHVYRALAQSCDAYAHHIDVAHHEIEAALGDLLEQTAIIESASAVFAVFTLGISELGGNVLEIERVAATLARIRQIVADASAALRSVATSIDQVLDEADYIAGSFTPLVNIRLTTAVLTHVRDLPVNAAIRVDELIAVSRLKQISADLPPLVVERSQVEGKFKHAVDLGVRLPRGREGFEALRVAIEEFPTRRGVVRIPATVGRYRAKPAILNYVPRTRMVVVQTPTGAFWTCFEMSSAQFFHVRRFASLSGG